MARRQCKICITRKMNGNTLYCSEACERTGRQIDEVHARDVSEWRNRVKAHLPYWFEGRLRPSVVIAGIVFPWYVKQLLEMRRKSLVES